jgi:FMN phosphatase YigB (HAD superfamily)
MYSTEHHKILFVDFNGTLCCDRFWRSLDKHSLDRLERWLFVKNQFILQQWMRGVWSAEEVTLSIADNTGLDYDTIWRVLVADCNGMRVRLEALHAIGELRTVYIVILVTVNMDVFSRFTVPALRLHAYFDEIVNSADVGVYKTDGNGSIFDEIAKRHGAELRDCILLDDSEDALRVFEYQGGLGLQVTCYEDLMSHIRTLASSKMRSATVG